MCKVEIGICWIFLIFPNNSWPMKLIALLSICIMLNACASIVSCSKWPVRVTSTPPGILVTITDAKGARVYDGITPANVELSSAQGYFKRQKYEVTFDMNGFKRTVPLECKVNGWYWGNILIGGAIGMLIVDPATGAMYKFRRDYINERMIDDLGALRNDLQILAFDDLPVPVRNELQLIEIVGSTSD